MTIFLVVELQHSSFVLSPAAWSDEVLALTLPCLSFGKSFVFAILRRRLKTSTRSWAHPGKLVHSFSLRPFGAIPKVVPPSTLT
jgi:hypothetical protein